MFLPINGKKEKKNLVNTFNRKLFMGIAENEIALVIKKVGTFNIF